METPGYATVLWRYKWLLVFGALVAAAAAFFAGFTLSNGQVVSRAVQTWNATTTMLVTSPSDTIYQAEIPGVPVEEGVSEPVANDLSNAAMVYAYVIASDEIQAAVEATIGPLDDETESISAVRRTTQPVGDEKFPGRYDLPVLEAIGTAATPERAELISQTAANAFVTDLTARQDARGLDPNVRVQVEVLGLNDAVEGESSNPAIPIVVTFFGVFLAFVVIAFIIAGIRSGIARRRASNQEVYDDEDDVYDDDFPVDDHFTAGHNSPRAEDFDDFLLDTNLEPVPQRRSRSRSDDGEG